MEIQNDLIVLPANNHLPLPWPVRGPLGLETGSEVSLALVESETGRLPTIIVTPLQSEFLHQTFTCEVILGERAGAIADFLTWFGKCVEADTGDNVNIVLSETGTLEGRKRHKIHIVVEPAHRNPLTAIALRKILDSIKIQHNEDVISIDVFPTHGIEPHKFLLEKLVRVDSGWLKYDGWLKKIEKHYKELLDTYDIGRVVVSLTPDQRLLRYIIPQKGVLEVRVPHRNKAGALRQISEAIRRANYNILSSRLSRTPPSPHISANTSVFVAVCEPVGDGKGQLFLKDEIYKIEATSYQIDDVRISQGRAALSTLYLAPVRSERVDLDLELAADRDKIRALVSDKYFTKYSRRPSKYIFISRRFIDANSSKTAWEEQDRCCRKICSTIEEEGCAVIEAADPGKDEDGRLDEYVYKAVFSRLWAADACLVLALDEKSTGNLSLSLAHEIGFFTGRNKPIRVLVSKSREKDPIFGNTVGKNRITYADGNNAFIDDMPNSIQSCVQGWLRTIRRSD